MAGDSVLTLNTPINRGILPPLRRLSFKPLTAHLLDQFEQVRVACEQRGLGPYVQGVAMLALAETGKPTALIERLSEDDLVGAIAFASERLRLAASSIRRAR